ncbi:MAG: lamin tail domain-containing protein [Alphaproteobacteria bacterium]|nr:lamin tail domain-containing protein [Alphaproteobacteria bacterium]MCB9792115.1 lamin tail domain-containing protein [Alphaproteobacteria bacterium]
MPHPLLLLVLLSAAACHPSGRLSFKDEAEDSGALPGDDSGLTEPGPDAPWLRQEEEAPGPVTFTELHYHPWGDDSGQEWLELHNPMVLDMDLSRWRLQGGVEYQFEDGVVLPAGGYLVVAADPGALAEQTGFEAALGPFAGQLANGGERIELRSRSGRLIDTLHWSDDAPWPVHPDGSGFTLAKRRPTAASDHAEHWTVSRERGGTPGAENGLDPYALPVTIELIAEDAEWRLELSGDEPDADWAAPDYDDSDWEIGQAPFYAGASAEGVGVTAWATADNYFAMYLGRADGSGLRLVGEDSDGSWTTVEEIDLEPEAEDHLYIAAWELTGDSGSTQMLIAELEGDDLALGSDVAHFEWALGPANDNPGGLPQAAPPSEAALRALIEDAELDGLWAPPAVETARGAAPWGASVGGDFTDLAGFIWADTFGSDSITNQQDTWALFRSVDPILGPRGNLELSEIPTTALFRADFVFEGDPSRARLFLDCGLDDGAAFSLNGVELHRENLPSGALRADTLATDEVVSAADERLYVELSTESLVSGENLLAVELHQASPEDADLLMGCRLVAELWQEASAPTVLINELPGAEPGWVELLNVSAQPWPLGDLRLVSSAGESQALPALDLAPGALALIEDLTLPLRPGDRLFLMDAEGLELLDAARLQEGPRARDLRGERPWRVPEASSPGEVNEIPLHEDVVIHELLYHHAPHSVEGEPFAEVEQEWIELYNRGEVAVDLGGWQLADAVRFTFPEGSRIEPGAYLVVARDAEALRAQHPDIEVLGELEGRLGNSADRVLLLDALGNPADEVPYVDGGRWPGAADGGGASLELQDPWADNAVAEAWAASDESGRAAWTEVRIRGEAGASVVGPDGVWEELVFGLLDAGELLIDDVALIRDPDGAAVDIVRNGGFDEADEAGAPARWRLLGTHRRGGVVPDPDDPSNPVLRVVATGGEGHMHNHVETTLREDIRSGEYELRFRARWVSGSNQLHSRLYFNRLPRTTLLPMPATSGTPGAPNSRAVDNLGPTLDGLSQSAAVPAPGEPVRVQVQAQDPDGVEAVDLWSSVDGGPWLALPMQEGEPGLWSAELPGEQAGALVQLYVEAVDARGASATLPAAGPDSRALYQVDDGRAASGGLHGLRLLMTEADADWLHEEVNLMSDDRIGATVIYDEREVFYDVGVRLKGSERGRPEAARVGYALRFRDDQPFRGSHVSAFIDRSEGTGYGQREVLLNLAMTHAGSVSGEHNDLIQLMGPRAAYDGGAELQLDRFSDLMLDAQFADGASGTRYEYELIYYPTSTDDGTPEGLKRPQPDSVIGTRITDLGDDPEDYRWIFLIKNNERQDDYAALMDTCQVFSLSDADFLRYAPELIDVDQWLRAFAMATLSGTTDQYGGAGSQHNAQLYVRPEDGRVLYFPHDLDFYSSSSMPVVNNSDLARLIEDPANARAYYGHLQDLIDTSYTTAHLGPWCEQLAALLPAQSWSSHCAFMDARAEYVRSGSSQSILSRFPQVDFAITTEGGRDFEADSATLALRGRAWVDVRSVRLQGAVEPLPLRWVDGQTWELTLTLEPGENPLQLEALDLHGAVVGADSVVVSWGG